MGLAKRIIPTLLADGEKLVKGKQFNPWRTVGVVEQAARICGSRAVDEIILLDVTATRQGREPNYELVRRISESVFTPLTVGGGVRSVEHITKLLRAGADKVAIGTAAYEVPDLIFDCSEHFGSQAIVMSIDVLGGNTVMTHCGKHGYNHSPVYTAGWAERYGAGEILLTSIDREGTMAGYDLDLIREVAQAVDIPVIAHGGCSGYPDMLAAIQAGADAVAAGALFQFTDATPRGAAQYLAAHGIETRIPACSS